MVDHHEHPPGSLHQETGPQASLLQSLHWAGGCFHPAPALLSCCCPPELGLGLILGPRLAWEQL